MFYMTNEMELPENPVIELNRHYGVALFKDDGDKEGDMLNSFVFKAEPKMVKGEPSTEIVIL